MSDMTGSVLLVGSVPLDTAAEVFSTCAQELGGHVTCLPDGEVGDRTIWVIFQAYRVFHEHAQLVTLHQPQRGKEPWMPGDLEDAWRFTIKEGPQEIQFSDLKYASAAVDSYRIFCRLRDQGSFRSPSGFRLACPLLWAVQPGSFSSPATWRA